MYICIYCGDYIQNETQSAKCCQYVCAECCKACKDLLRNHGDKCDHIEQTNS